MNAPYAGRAPIGIGYEQLTVPAGVVKLSPPALMQMARIKFVDGPVRFTLDGTTPSAGATGMTGYDIDERFLNIHEALSAQFIRDGAVNGLVQATYYRLP